MTDLVLAIAHHLLAFGLLAILVTERGMLRPSLTAAELRRLGLVDAHYGAVAALLIVVGVGRVFMGAKGAPYYAENPWFWAKMASFGAVGLLSAGPTIRILGWRRAAKADPAALPTPEAIAGVRRLVMAQLIVFPLIPAFAAVMARYSA